MKIILPAILAAIILMVSGANSQNIVVTEQQSILKQLPLYNPSPIGNESVIITSPDGFDNFFLGTDFGEPHIATNPRDPLNSICAFNINNFYYTLDGINWTKTNVIFYGFGVLGDPVLAFDSLGNAYYATLYQNGGVYGIAVAKSTNKGVTWGQVTGASSTTVGLSDKEWIVADQTNGPYSNRIYIGWRQFGATGMRFVYSANGGLNWSTPVVLSGNQGAYVAVGPNGNVPGGNVYFAATGSGGILFTRSTNGGESFIPQTVAASVSSPGTFCPPERYSVKGCIRIDGFPRMDADNSYTSTRGNVYITYANNPPGADVADINLIRSTDYGATWSAPIRVNDDETTTDQWMPAINVDEVTGKIYVTWYDSRIDPANNKLTLVYGAVSTNGGQSFMPNFRVSEVPFDPDFMKVNQGNHYYMGDYHGNSSIRNTSYVVWMDGRSNNLGSFTGFYPDFAMKISPTTDQLINTDSTEFVVKVPQVKGLFNERIKFTASLDTLPSSGSILISFANNKDSITTIPDSVIVKVKSTGAVTPRLYKLKIQGRGLSGVPAHERVFDLFVNASQLTIGTNRPGIAEYKVNGVQYNTTKQFVFPNGTSVNVQALSPKTIGNNRYVFKNWSDNGDTSHNVIISSHTTLTAFYKIQFKLILSSAIGNTFGGNEFYDSASTFTFGVLSRVKDTLGATFTFRGWTGGGVGSYTSPDSTGNDTAVTWSMHNPVVETARWDGPIGINNLSSELPVEYKLYQNFPNPFNPVTTINFDIVNNDRVKIAVYDMLGRLVTVLADQLIQPGKYSVQFNAANLASGIYYYRLETNDFVDIKKLVLLK